MGGVIDPDWLGFHIALKVFGSFPVLLKLGSHGVDRCRVPRNPVYGQPDNLRPAAPTATANTSYFFAVR
jgi:hypothetical protein